jgi:hypothetical protein
LRSGSGLGVGVSVLERLSELGEEVLETSRSGGLLGGMLHGRGGSGSGSRLGLLVGGRLTPSEEAEQLLESLEGVLRSSLSLLLLLLLSVLVGDLLASAVLLLGNGGLSELVLLNDPALLLKASLAKFL